MHYIFIRVTKESYWKSFKLLISLQGGGEALPGGPGKFGQFGVQLKGYLEI